MWLRVWTVVVFLGISAHSSMARAVCLSQDCICGGVAVVVNVPTDIAPNAEGSVVVQSRSRSAEALFASGETLPFSHPLGLKAGTRWYLAGDAANVTDSSGTRVESAWYGGTELSGERVRCGTGFSLTTEEAFAAVDSASCFETIRTAGFRQPPCNDSPVFPCASAPGVGLLALLGLLPRRRRS